MKMHSTTLGPGILLLVVACGLAEGGSGEGHSVPEPQAEFSSLEIEDCRGRVNRCVNDLRRRPPRLAVASLLRGLELHS